MRVAKVSFFRAASTSAATASRTASMTGTRRRSRLNGQLSAAGFDGGLDAAANWGNGKAYLASRRCSTSSE